MSKIEITVLFATRNGEHVLPRVLEGYRRAVAPPVGWRLLIVDNGSTDRTSHILESSRRYLPLEVLHQPVAGKNRALNAGIEAVSGRLIVIVDDDVIPTPDFLTAWAAYLERQPEYGLLGGAIELLFEVAPPDWLLESKLGLEMMFGRRNLPEGPTGWDQIFGGNMAVRASVLASGFRFDEKIGPNALDEYYPMGGEAEFCRRVALSGARSWFTKGPAVRHIVRPKQLTVASWAKRAYRGGRGRAYLMWQEGKLRPSSTSESLTGKLSRPAKYYWRRLTLTQSPQSRFNNLCVYHFQRGFRDECARRGADPIQKLD